MPAVRCCVICERPLDDSRRRRSDAVTCGASCRTLLWRARRKIRRDGGVPYVDVNSDGYGSLVNSGPPARRPGESPWSQSDDRFYSQAALQDEGAVTLTRAERAWQSRNPGVMHPAVQQRLLDRELARRRREAEEAASHGVIKVEVPSDPASHGSVAKRGLQSRRANRPVDPYERMLSPGRLPGPARYPGALEAEMIDTPWGRSTPRSAIGW
jgi:hypothetical protein